ncbi:MAG: hypothetical protein WCO33_00410 [bacterium]
MKKYIFFVTTFFLIVLFFPITVKAVDAPLECPRVGYDYSNPKSDYTKFGDYTCCKTPEAICKDHIADYKKLPITAGMTDDDIVGYCVSTPLKLDISSTITSVKDNSFLGGLGGSCVYNDNTNHFTYRDDIKATTPGGVIPSTANAVLICGKDGMKVGCGKYIDVNGANGIRDSLIDRTLAIQTLRCIALYDTDSVLSVNNNHTPYSKEFAPSGVALQALDMCCPENDSGDTLVLESKVGQGSAPCQHFYQNTAVKRTYTSTEFVSSFKPSEICKADSKVNGAPDDSNINKACCICLTGSESCPDPKDGDPKSTNVWTGIGCISTTTSGFAVSLLRILFGIITFVLLIRIVQAGYLYQFGEPDKIKEAWQIIGSVIMGAVVFTAGILILRFIGFDVLGLGDFLGALPTLK